MSLQKNGCLESKKFLASWVTQLEVKTMIIGATETLGLARLLMSENRTESFAIVQTFYLMIILSSCRSVQHVLNLACFSERDTYHAKWPRRYIRHE